MFGIININKALKEYEETKGAVLVDVREKDEYARGHIPGAVNVPLSVISSINYPKETPLFLYCLRGSRARSADGILRRMGYTKVKSIGGISRYQGRQER